MKVLSVFGLKIKKHPESPQADLATTEDGMSGGRLFEVNLVDWRMPGPVNQWSRSFTFISCKEKMRIRATRRAWEDVCLKAEQQTTDAVALEVEIWEDGRWKEGTITFPALFLSERFRASRHRTAA